MGEPREEMSLRDLIAAVRWEGFTNMHDRLIRRIERDEEEQESLRRRLNSAEAKLREYGKIIYIEPSNAALRVLPEAESAVIVPKSVEPLLDRIVKLEAELHRHGIYE